MSDKVVLLVEDDDDTRAIYAVYLRHNGYEVLEVSDGAMAITAMRFVKPHLVLLDIALPIMSGWTVARWMKQVSEIEKIPVVALTAAGSQEDRIRAVNLGFVDHLIKPVEPKDVLACLHRLIGPALVAEA